MNVETIREYCLSKKGVTESFPFDNVSLVMKVMDKMFALIDLEGANSISLKCDPERAIALRDEYEAIVPAWHFNKKHWNTIFIHPSVSKKLLCELIRHSYDLVVAKLPRKLRHEMES